MATQQGRRAPESPLTVNIARLGRRPGSMITVAKTVPSPARIGLDLVGIDRDAPFELDLQLQSVSEGVLVTGTVFAPTTGECARCLTAVTGDVEIELTELFAYPETATEATTDSEEIPRVGASGVPDTVDLEQPIIDAVGLALPFAPLCRDDCPGLCTVCGAPLAEAGPDHGHDQIDPRWAKLSGMFSQPGDGGS
ncbi:DUF177 domain-containing protein [Mycobacterium sp. MYCO198283]|uniref:YceD family protein n=1 Tax=Mycobacterium sp. MYCO198283 TaxID=2883505 RepID=UPI001E2B7997|nr:DUF177 domain-containing protein [Mycobacterium sp. MYCO198283]MCG5433720.1 DUF177 domain-containing protein [Mycobacterium sp. MYCO198283]